MSRGMTIAEFVQQVLYAVYKERLDTRYSDEVPQAFHADTDRFKEVVMEANFVLQELQKEQDWNWLRARWNIGVADILEDNHIMEFEIPRDVYKVSTMFNDAVRMHHPKSFSVFTEVPYTSPRSGTVNTVAMFDTSGQINTRDSRLHAFVVGNTLTFSRPFMRHEKDWVLETDVIRLLDPLHICGPECAQPCPQSYEDQVFTEISDPYYMVARTAAKRAEGDPSAADRVQSLVDESTKMLSAMRENDSAKTVPDTYDSIELGYTRIF